MDLRFTLTRHDRRVHLFDGAAEFNGEMLLLCGRSVPLFKTHDEVDSSYAMCRGCARAADQFELST